MKLQLKTFKSNNSQQTSGDKVSTSGDKVSTSGDKVSTSGDKVSTSGDKMSAFLWLTRVDKMSLLVDKNHLDSSSPNCPLCLLLYVT